MLNKLFKFKLLLKKRVKANKNDQVFKIFNFKKKKWSDIIEHYRKLLLPFRYRKYKLVDPSKILISNFRNNFNKYKNKYKQLLYLNKDKRFASLMKEDKSIYLDKISLIKNKGYLINESETTRGVIDIGVPIYIPEINVNAVLAVTILSGQLQELLDSNKIIDKLLDSVDGIYRNLGIPKE